MHAVDDDFWGAHAKLGQLADEPHVAQLELVRIRAGGITPRLTVQVGLDVVVVEEAEFAGQHVNHTSRHIGHDGIQRRDQTVMANQHNITRCRAKPMASSHRHACKCTITNVA